MTRMHFGKDSKAIVKAEVLRKIEKYNLDKKQRAVLLHFIDKLLFLNRTEKKEFKEIIKQDKKFLEVINSCK